MRQKELKTVLKDAISNKDRILIVGPPGIGKTDIVIQACSELNMQVMISHPAISDPTDFKGFPSKASDGESATFLPFGDLKTAMETKDPLVWFYDDLGQASESVQKALMQLLLGKQLNNHKISNNVVFVGATNDIGQRSGVSGLIEPVKSRWDSIIKLDPSADDWIEWAYLNQIPAEIIAFIKINPKSLHDFTPTMEIKNQPSPRTWASLGRRLARGVRNIEIIEGTIGKGTAAEFMAFLKMTEKCPSVHDIIKKPDTENIPDEPSLRYLVCSNLAKIADSKNIKNIMKYLYRMDQPMRFFTMKSMTLTNEKIIQTSEFIEWIAKEGSGVIS